MKVRQMPEDTILWKKTKDVNGVDVLGIKGCTLDLKYYECECYKLPGNVFDYMLIDNEEENTKKYKARFINKYITCLDTSVDNGCINLSLSTECVYDKIYDAVERIEEVKKIIKYFNKQKWNVEYNSIDVYEIMDIVGFDSGSITLKVNKLTSDQIKNK